MAAGITLVGRLRKDSALRDLPPVLKQKGRGRPRVYGLNRLSLAKRAAHPGGWSAVTCSVYGRDEVKTVKMFLATHATFGGAIQVVIVKEPTGPQFFYCTDVDASVREIVEAFANRSTIEQVFHNVKEVWGSGIRPHFSAENGWTLFPSLGNFGEPRQAELYWSVFPLPFPNHRELQDSVRRLEMICYRLLGSGRVGLSRVSTLDHDSGGPDHGMAGNGSCKGMMQG